MRAALTQTTSINSSTLIDDTLEFIAQVKKNEYYTNFMDSLVDFLAKKLTFDYVFVDEIDPHEANYARTVSFYSQSQILPNFTYELKNTPCNEVYGKKLCCYTHKVRSMFPDNRMLFDLSIESYVGIPLWSTDGRPIGIIGLMHSEALYNTSEIERVLQLVAVRASQELETMLMLKKMKKRNDLLKHVVQFQTELVGTHTVIGIFRKMHQHLVTISGTKNLSIFHIMPNTCFGEWANIQLVSGRTKKEPVFQNIDEIKFLKAMKRSGVSKEQVVILGDLAICKCLDQNNRINYLVIQFKTINFDTEIVKMYLHDALLNIKSIRMKEHRMQEQIQLFKSIGEIIEKRDQSTLHHVERVSEGVKILASAMGYNDEKLQNIVIASSIHDIGKVYIPDSILNNPGILTDDEFEIIKTHTTGNFELLNRATSALKDTVYNVVRHHHENWDGTGYPDGLKHSSIPEQAQIVSIIDVFEALTQYRPYKLNWSYERAVKFITDNAGIKFSPPIVEVFKSNSKRIFEKFSEFE